MDPKTPPVDDVLSVPDPVAEATRERIILEGDLPSPANPPSGCYFHPRCSYNDGKQCVSETPQLREVRPGHHVRCHYAETLNLTGVEA